MNIGIYPFASTGNIRKNLSVILSAADEAAKRGVRLLVFHECALSGYPPIECSVDEIDPVQIQNALEEIKAKAREKDIYIAVGTVRFDQGRRFNSVLLFDNEGNDAGCYDKTSLWGWDTENFTRGEKGGVFLVDGIKVGFRICFDVRFPESFRDLYLQQVPLCFVCFSDTSDDDDRARYDLLCGHLSTRAMENVMTVVSVNSLSRYQTAPSAVFDTAGSMILEAERNREQLLVYDYQIPDITFGMRGRIAVSDYFLSRRQNSVSQTDEMSLKISDNQISDDMH